MDYSHPETRAVVFSCAEKRQAVMVVGLYHGTGLSGKDKGYVLKLEMLLQRLYELNYKAHFLMAVEAGLRMQAVVAAAAVVLEIVLPEVIEKELPTALAGFGIGNGFLEELPADFLLCDGFPLHELLQFLDILVAVVCDAGAFLAVTARTPGFLVITLYALWNVIVNHKAHVLLVYAHAEGDGGHNDVYLLHQELVLVFGPGFGIQAGMVRKGPDAVYGQHLGKFFHLLAAEAVDDAALAGILAEVTDYVLFRFHLVPYLII